MAQRTILLNTGTFTKNPPLAQINENPTTGLIYVCLKQRSLKCNNVQVDTISPE